MNIERKAGTLPTAVSRSIALGGAFRGPGQYHEMLQLFQTMQGLLKADRPWAIGITSCSAGEGATSIAEGLACVASLRRNVATMFCSVDYHNVDQSDDLSETLRERSDLSDIRSRLPRDAGGVFRARICNRAILEAFASDIANALSIVQMLKSSFGQIIFDLPASPGFSLATSFSRALDGVIVVLEAEKTPATDVAKLTSSIEACGGTMLGAVLNKHRTHIPKRFRK